MAVAGRRWPIPFRFRQHIIAPTGGGGGTVTYDAVGPAGGAGLSSATSPITWTHVNSGNCIVIYTIFEGNATNPVTAVTYGGVTIPLVKAQISNTGGGCVAYGLVGGTVPTGSNTVSVSFSTDTLITGSVSLGNVLSLGTPVSSNAATAASSATISVPGTTTGGMIVAGTSYGGGSGGGTFTGTNGVTIRWQKTVTNSGPAGNGVEGTVASTGGGASQTVGFSDSAGSDQWAIVAVEALPAAGSPALHPPKPLINSSAASMASLY